jgi:hypothetical protein
MAPESQSLRFEDWHVDNRLTETLHADILLHFATV